MSSEISSPAHPAAIQRFRDKYLALLRRCGIDPRAERWYARREGQKDRVVLFGSPTLAAPVLG